jgi:hypothetical protein
VQRAQRVPHLRRPSGLLPWAAADRAVVTFAGLADIDAHTAAVAAIVRR